MSYVYRRTEPTLWTVGYTDGGGNWEPESDHGSAREAADRVYVLNGGAPTDALDRQYAAGHRGGYMDAIAEVWEIQRESHPHGTPGAQILEDLIGDLRYRYNRVKERSLDRAQETTDETVPA